MHRDSRLRRTLTRTGLLGVALALASASLAACGGGGTNSSTSDRTLTVSIPTAPQGLNLPTNCSSPIFQFTYDSLIRVSASGGYKPGLAKSWKYSNGNTTFTMHLRHGVKFADGTNLNATSVVNTLKWLQKTPGINQGYLKNFSSIKAPNNTTVVINMAQPFHGMETLLSNDGECNNGFPISAAGLANPKKMGTQTFGAGAYVLDSKDTVPGDHYALTPNKNYWNPAEQHWNKIVIRVIPDPNTALQALQTGQTDIQLQANAPLVPTAKNAGLNITKGGNVGASLMLLDRNGQVAPALKDVRVRQAINYALDRKGLANILGPGWKPLVQFALPDASGYDPSLENVYNYNPNRAKQLLAEAGYAHGFDVKIADLHGDSGSPDSTQAIIQQLAAIGIKATSTDAKDVPTFVADMTSKKYSAVNFRILGDVYFDAVRLVVPPFDGALNPFNTSNPSIDAAYKALAKSNGAAFEENAKTLNKVITNQAFFANYAYSSAYAFSSSSVGSLGKMTPLAQFDVLSWAPAK